MGHSHFQNVPHHAVILVGYASFACVHACASILKRVIICLDRVFFGSSNDERSCRCNCRNSALPLLKILSGVGHELFSASTRRCRSEISGFGRVPIQQRPVSYTHCYSRTVAARYVNFRLQPPVITGIFANLKSTA